MTLLGSECLELIGKILEQLPDICSFILGKGGRGLRLALDLTRDRPTWNGNTSSPGIR